MLEQTELKTIGEIIGNDVSNRTCQKMEEIGRRLLKEGKHKSSNDLVKLTKKRLFAYRHLQNNIRRYELDIEDIKKEENFGKSKSIVRLANGNRHMDPEEAAEAIRAEKIYRIEKKIERDQAELKELDAALDGVRQERFYVIIEKYFFEQKSLSTIALEINYDVSTVSRQLTKLVNMMSIVLYGADVLH